MMTFRNEKLNNNNSSSFNINLNWNYILIGLGVIGVIGAGYFLVKKTGNNKKEVKKETENNQTKKVNNKFNKDIKDFI